MNNDAKADLASFARDCQPVHLRDQPVRGHPVGQPRHRPFLTFPGDVPFSGDFDGDGKADYGLLSPSNSQFYVVESSLVTATRAS